MVGRVQSVGASNLGAVIDVGPDVTSEGRLGLRVLIGDYKDGSGAAVFIDALARSARRAGGDLGTGSRDDELLEG